jgi:hypothetical protein
MSNKIKVQAITLNSSNQYMGGKIYFCSFSPNFSEKPSEVQVNVISDTGAYQKPNINFSASVKVKIGNLDLGDMYPYKYKNRYSSQGNILEVSFIDPSFILDKIFIGLMGKHGWSTSFSKEISERDKKTFSEALGIPSSSSSSSSSGVGEGTDIYHRVTDNFWLIGRQFHPCDENKDNVITHQEAYNVDPCDPCPSCPEDKYENRCQELAYTTIFEVGYSFQDLIDMIASFSIKQGSTTITLEVPTGLSADQLNKFYRDYHGPLREVLTAWANDFGLNWYYDIKDKKIKFIDISSKEIQVDVKTTIAKYDKKSLISYDHEVSAENTSQRGAISWYERGGERKSADCSKANTVILSALYGADYLGNRSRTLLKGDDINSNTDIMGSILRAYNPLLRELFWQRAVYKMNKSSDLIDYINDFSIGIASNSSSSSSSSVPFGSLGDDNYEYQSSNNKILPELGDMQVLAVIDCGLSKSDKEKTTFQKFANAQYEDLTRSMNTYDRIKFIQNSGFFVVAYINEDTLAKRYDMEDELYSFLGKFFIREHLFRLCGITGNDEFVKNNTNLESADGTATIYSKKDGIGSHPLSKYKFYKSGYLGCIVGSGNVSMTDPKSDGKSIGQSQGFAMQERTANGINTVQLQETPQNYIDAGGSAGSMISPEKGKESMSRFEQTAIILEREPKWHPEVQLFQDQYNDYINKNLSQMEWKLFGNNGMPPGSDWVTTAFGGNTGFLKSGIAGSIKVFVVETGDFPVYPLFQDDFGSTLNHPKDQTATSSRKMLRRVGGKYSPQTPIGLLNNTCHKITFGGNKTLPEIYTPPHTFVKATKKDLIEKDIISKTKSQGAGGGAKSCDAGLQTETHRVPAYRIYVSQAFSQAVTLPKIQTGVFSNMKCDPTVRNLNVTYTKLTDDDFKSYTGSNGYGCIPNMNYLSGINNAYTGNVFSNTIPDDSLNIEIKGLPDLQDYAQEIKQGLDNVNIQISDQGINSTLQYSTKMVKGISSDLLKFQNSRRFDKGSRGI